MPSGISSVIHFRFPSAIALYFSEISLKIKNSKEISNKIYQVQKRYNRYTNWQRTRQKLLKE